MAAYVQDNKALALTVSTGTWALGTLTNTPNAANTLTLELAWNGADTVVSSGAVTDSAGNTWTQVAQIAETTGAVVRTGMWYTQMNVGAPTTVTIAATHTTTNKIFYAVREWAGKCTLDKSATAVLTVTSTAATTGTTAATMVASEFALAMFGLSTAQTSWTKDANYTLPTTNLTSDATQARALASEYRDLVATGTQVATGTMATTCLNATIIATFINPTGGIPDVGMALTVT